MKSEKVREQAFRDYQEGMKYKEIAEKYGVSLSTVKSWASRYWKKVATLKKKVATKREKGCNQRKE
ncbi:MAG: helix-turn-helix domain-containing protein [Gallintestinimicrobium sp.]